MQWQSELHGEPSILAVSAEQNSGQRYKLSQQQLKYTIHFWGEQLYNTYSAIAVGSSWDYKSIFNYSEIMCSLSNVLFFI